jgi:hypothetical protein
MYTISGMSNNNNNNKNDDEKSLPKSHMYTLYHYLKSITAGVVPDADLRQRMITDMANDSTLSKYLDVSWLQECFMAFYNQNKSVIEQDCKHELLYTTSTVKTYYFVFDNLTWRGTIQYSTYSLSGKAFKGIDVKLPNDGFVYTSKPGADYQKPRHQANGWKLMDSVSAAALALMRDTMEKISGCKHAPIHFYHMPLERLDIQSKDFPNQLSYSVCFENGPPTHDFDEDLWK